MKKTILFVLLLSAITSCKSQEEINFKVGYLPNLNYTLTQKQISENTVKYIASDQFLQNLENNGIKNPTSTKEDRKSTRLNSSHVRISYAVFCLKKKKKKKKKIIKKINKY